VASIAPRLADPRLSRRLEQGAPQLLALTGVLTLARLVDDRQVQDPPGFEEAGPLSQDVDIERRDLGIPVPAPRWSLAIDHSVSPRCTAVRRMKRRRRPVARRPAGPGGDSVMLRSPRRHDRCGPVLWRAQEAREIEAELQTKTTEDDSVCKTVSFPGLLSFLEIV
jgi:hypothetical protein